MGKIFFFNVGALGHINPTIPIAKELINKGHEVRYFNYESYRNVIEEQGISFVPYYDDMINNELRLSRILKALKLICNKDEIGYFAKKLKGNFNSPLVSDAILLAYDTSKLLKSTENLLLKEKPDCIVVDNMCPWPRYASEKLNIPIISTVITLLTQNDISKLEEIEHTQKETNKLVNKFLIKTREEFGLLTHQKDELHGFSKVKNLLFTSKRMQGEVDDSDNRIFNFEFIGPSLIDKKCEISFPWEKFNRFNGKRIFVSLGTISEDENFYKKVIEAFRNKNILVIMNVGKSSAIDIENVGDNFIIMNSVPQTQIIRNVDCVICHGGMNTLHEAIYYGKPVCIFPLINDQFFWANRVIDLKVGLVEDIQQITAEELYRKAFEIINNNIYSDNAMELKKDLIRSGGFKRAAEIIEETFV